MTPDHFNGLFELIGAIVTWRNVLQLHRDKVVKGVYWPIWGFFAAWGCWNIYYYHAIQQPWSWMAGTLLAAGNVFWFAQACWYARRPKEPGVRRSRCRQCRKTFWQLASSIDPYPTCGSCS